MKCPWCLDGAADERTPGVPERLCIWHLAEHDGMSVAELERMEREQAAEYREWVGA